MLSKAEPRTKSWMGKIQINQKLTNRGLCRQRDTDQKRPVRPMEFEYRVQVCWPIGLIVRGRVDGFRNIHFYFTLFSHFSSPRSYRDFRSKNMNFRNQTKLILITLYTNIYWSTAAGATSHHFETRLHRCWATDDTRPLCVVIAFWRCSLKYRNVPRTIRRPPVFPAAIWSRAQLYKDESVSKTDSLESRSYRTSLARLP